MLIGIVEDEPALASLLQDYLHNEGFETITWDNGSEALDALTAELPDLLLLDLMIPGVDGLSICREIRKVSSMPVIMVTARIDEIDRLLGLEIGADDYICKPFSPREVVARVKAVLRRTQSETNDIASREDVLTVDSATARALFNQEFATLTAVELKLLQALLGSPGRIFNREQLMRRIYPDNRIVSDRTIDSHVKKLRHKLQHLMPGNDVIHSVYGLGYKYEP